MLNQLRNVAIIAHVDHGKTTLVDCLLTQAGMLDNRAAVVERMMDSNDLEKERGITILSKNTAVEWHGYRINIVDTPGHADFGGEVERVLSMVDSVLLVVDAVDGPMPQTRFVTMKAFAAGLRPIVVINKVDRDGARPNWVINQIFDLFVNLGATDEQLEFPIVYASALRGYSMLNMDEPGTNMDPLFQSIVDHCPAPPCDATGPLQMQISTLDYSSYVGTIGIGRIRRGVLRKNMQVMVVEATGKTRAAKVLQVMKSFGLERREVEEASAGDIVAVSGIEPLCISDTLCDKSCVEGLPLLTVDEPTVSMTFQVNDSPFSGKDGDFVTSRQIRARLQKECLHNVALRVEDMPDPDKFRVSGRGELHLSILLETMRREGYEIAVARPEVILKKMDNDEIHEPFEALTVDVEEKHQGTIMEKLGERQGDLLDMSPDGKGRVRLDYLIPARGLMSFHIEFLTLTSGTGIMTHVFDHYGPMKKGATTKSRASGALISSCAGQSTGFAIWNLQARGKMFIGPQVPVYEGMIVGMHTRDNDLIVNVAKEKQLSNVRASGKDENIILVPPIELTLERALEWINEDELVEITPKNIRLRKRLLTENDRKRSGRV